MSGCVSAPFVEAYLQRFLAFSDVSLNECIELEQLTENVVSIIDLPSYGGVCIY